MGFRIYYYERNFDIGSLRIYLHCYDTYVENRGYNCRMVTKLEIKPKGILLVQNLLHIIAQVSTLLLLIFLRITRRIHIGVPYNSVILIFDGAVL